MNTHASADTTIVAPRRLRRWKPARTAALLLCLALPAHAVKPETAAVLGSLALLGGEAAVAALRDETSWAVRLADAARPDGWLLRGEWHEPRGAFAERYRDIDMQALDVLRGWQLGYGFELQLGAGMLRTDGLIDEPFATRPPQDSSTFGLQLGPGLRYQLPEWHGLRLYAESSLQLLMTAKDFPTGGTRANGLIRRGLGLRYDVSARGSFEFAYRHAHVSNGGLGEHNPAWDGEGFALGWRFRF